MELNRSFGIDLIEDRMIDECRIYRDVAGPFDATLNEITGALEGGSEVELYAGKCLITKMLTRDMQVIDGGMPKFVDNYKLLIPYTSGANVKLGDKIQITTSTYDDLAPLLPMIVYSLEAFTHTLYRRIIAQALRDQMGSTRGME